MPTDLLTLRKTVNRKLAEFNAARAACKTESASLEDSLQYQQDCEDARELAQQVAQQVQQQAHDQIAGVVSRCLEAVFDEPYEFRLNFERKRGRTEARLSFVREGMEVDPLTASGGGVVDVAAFSLRLSCLMLAQPPLRRLLIMDEPFKYVSEEYRDRIRTLLETLATEMKIQLVMVTHITELKTGTVLEL